MVNANDEITVVLSKTFVYYPALQKVLVLLWLAFVFCCPFKIKIVKKVNTATCPPAPGARNIRTFFPCIIKKVRSRAYGRFSWIQHC